MRTERREDAMKEHISKLSKGLHEKAARDWGTRSIDMANVQMLQKADREDIRTAFKRSDDQHPHCIYCERGVSCRNCMMGPCRLSGKDPKMTGVCGASAHTMVARGLLRNVLGGASSHIDHARHAALTLLEAAEGTVPYTIRDEGKLRHLAGKLSIDDAGTMDMKELARKVCEVALDDLGRQKEGTMQWVRMHATEERVETWERLGVLPVGADRTITEGMHRSHMGVDADPVNISLGIVKSGIADGVGLHMATDVQDVLFGTPSPRVIEASLGVIDKDSINIAVHGHVPILSEKIVEATDALQEKARQTGAKGINVVGICCTGNELLMRQGVPIAGNELNSELAIVTGALDAMVVDVQCVYPAVVKVAESYHTKVITTSPIAKIPGAEHVEFVEARADEIAQRIVRIAIDNYKNREDARVEIPDIKEKAIVGFSVESILGVLKKIDGQDPLKPLIDNIANGNISGVVAVVGCNNPKVKHDFMHLRIAEELVRRNILVIATGCAAIAHAKAGLMSPDGYKKAGARLQEVLKALGQAAGLEALPPVLHFGSCVDNSRIAVLLKALAEKLNVPIHKLPVAASAPEAATEKALSIGTWAVALGVTTHVNPVPRVTGSSIVTKLLTEDVEGLLGGRFMIGGDPEAVAHMLEEHIMKKRKGLGLAVPEGEDVGGRKEASLAKTS
jgi:carbon-monoxide dehydrogenase catalytic subunit